MTVESSRRHGWYDSRFWPGFASSPKSRHSLVTVTMSRGDRASLDAWEDEGGYAADDSRQSASQKSEDAPAGLTWRLFAARFFPRRHCHDVEALNAYAVYRSLAGGQSESSLA